MKLTAHHVTFLAPGAAPDAVLRFYRDGLGLTPAPKPPSLAHYPVLWFSAGPVLFHVAYPAKGLVGEGHTALAADDVEAARAHLSSMGYAPEAETISMGYPRFFVRDPWGNSFEVLPTGLPER